MGHRGIFVPFGRVKDVHLTEGPPSLKIHRLKTGRTERHFTRQHPVAAGTLPGVFRSLMGSPSHHGSSCGSSCTAPQWRFDVVASSHERSLSIWSFGHVWSQHREAPRASSVRITFASANLGFFDDQSTPSKHNKPVKPLSSWIFCRVIGKFAGVEGSVFSDLKG